MSNEVFRSVNKYIDFSTGDEELRYTKSYNTPGKAKAAATRWRKQNKKYGNPNNATQVPVTRHWGQTTETQYHSYFEFAETWVEKVVEWERV